MLVGSTTAEKIWNFCLSKGINAYGASAVLATMDAESKLNPKNLQDGYESVLGFTDDSYTSAVDNGSYSKEKFIHDSAGYQLAQWTWWTRKKALYEYAKACGKSIGDLEVGLGFFYKEMSESFPSVLFILKTGTSVEQTVTAMTLKYEAPANAREKIKKRAEFAETYYKRFVTNRATKDVVVMGYKTCQKGKITKLSTFFNSTEFDCHGNGCCSSTPINKKLVEYLNKIREHFGKPITITSGYRCPIHNKNVGGATGSRHSKGDAADIVVQGVAPRTVAQYAESIGILGIGLYETKRDGYFVHIDTREYKSFWYGQACAVRTTFGTYSGTASSGSSTTTTTNQGNYLLAMGSSGSKVKELQQNLIKLGYSCGSLGADGSYGVGTANAVKEFQKKNGLNADGIAGYQTLTAIKKKVSSGSGYSVHVVASVLNIRSGAGTNYPICGVIKDRGTYVVVEEAAGTGATKWGLLEKYKEKRNGWISLDYCKKG